MLPASKSRRVLVLVLLAACNGVLARPQRAQTRQEGPKLVSSRGRQLFSSTCSACHGLDGRGGERAPNIAGPSVQRLSDAQVSHIIENGILGTAMPAFRSLQNSDIQAVVTYLRTLQGTKTAVKLPGDAHRGREMFFGKAGCSGCHMAAGAGGFMASDLSGYAATHSAEQTRNAILHSVADSGWHAQIASVTTHSGEKYTGRIRNEDNFSLQLQALDGTFHFVAKSDLAEYSAQPLIHSDYGSVLSQDEMNDLLSFLMSTKAATSEAPPRMDEEE